MDNNLKDYIDIYSEMITSNEQEKDSLTKYIVENIEDKSFREQFVNDINSYVSSPCYDFTDINYKKNLDNMIKSINENFNETYVLNTAKGKIYENEITLDQYIKLLEKLHIDNVKDIFVYKIEEFNNFIKQSKIGVLLNLNGEINIVDIPVDINDPLQVNYAEKELYSIIEEHTLEEQYENVEIEQEIADIEL